MTGQYTRHGGGLLFGMKERCQVLARYGCLPLLVALIGGGSLGQPPPSVAAGGQQGGAARPLLHLDFVRDGRSMKFITAVTSPDGRRLAQFDYSDAGSAVWSPDGTRFVAMAQSASSPGGSLKIMDLDGSAETLLNLSDEESLTGWLPAWSPDGDRIAVTVYGRTAAAPNRLAHFVLVVDVDERAVRSRLAIPEGTLRLPRHLSPPDKFRWSPNGRYILVSWENAVVLDVEEGRAIRISTEAVVAAWTPGSDAVLYFEGVESERGSQPTLAGLYSLNLATGERVEIAGATVLAAAGLAEHTSMHDGLLDLSPSASKLSVVQGLAGSQQSRLLVYDVDPAAPLDLADPVKTLDIDEVIVKLEWSPDEESLAALMIPRSATFRQGPFGPPVIKTLALAGDEWRTVVTMNFDLRYEWPQSLELMSLERVLSWTR